MVDGAQKNENALGLIAGLCLGCLTGILVGLATTSIVTTIISSIIAMVTAYLGVGGETKLVGTSPSSTRLIGFSLAMSVALLAGVWMRTHQTLSPTPKEVVEQLQLAGYSSEEAKLLVRMTNFGLTPEGISSISPEVSTSVFRQSRGSLFSANADRCADLGRDEGLNAEERIARLQSYGGDFAEAASRLKNLPADRQVQTLNTARFYLCGT